MRQSAAQIPSALSQMLKHNQPGGNSSPTSINGVDSMMSLFQNMNIPDSNTGLKKLEKGVDTGGQRSKRSISSFSRFSKEIGYGNYAHSRASEKSNPLEENSKK